MPYALRSAWLRTEGCPDRNAEPRDNWLKCPEASPICPMLLPQFMLNEEDSLTAKLLGTSVMRTMQFEIGRLIGLLCSATKLKEAITTSRRGDRPRDTIEAVRRSAASAR